jgi:hypothetical protein
MLEGWAGAGRSGAASAGAHNGWDGAGPAARSGGGAGSGDGDWDPPARTSDHGTAGPRSGGAASGGRGARYGSVVHDGCTSSGRWAAGRGSASR